MKHPTYLYILPAALCIAAACARGASAENDYPLKPVPFNRVKLEDRFWLPRLKIQSETTVPHALGETEPAVERLRKCAAFLKDNTSPKPRPHRFISSDLFKVMEGAAYTLMIKPNRQLEQQLDEIIEIIAAAQQDDGYLYVSHTCGNPNPGEMGETPYSWVVHSHELYNLGHMYEGAIAYYRASGKDRWLRIAEKSARHFNKVFFEGDPNYNNGKPVMQAPGHQELELALCKMYRVTGKKVYLDMARRFLDIRGVTYRPEGDGTMSPTYAQQHRPVVEQDKAVGHAVRAGYLYAAMADVSALTGDMRYARAAERIWHDVVDTKMHIIGGLGATHGIEGFGKAYDLPNRDTYNETCAAVANVLFNFRMYLLSQDAKYLDVAEISLLNNSLAGMSLKGDTFFYVNVLESDGIKKFNHGTGGRAPWFGCACCPSNLARLMPQISGYMYSHTKDEIHLGLYGSSSTEISLAGGNVRIKQVSNYPFDGKISLEIDPLGDQQFSLKLRIPTWAVDKFVPGDLYRYVGNAKPQWTVSINGKGAHPKLVKGFATIRRMWRPGDQVKLHLPMPVRYNVARTEVVANHNRLAITRGPLVYCAEQADNGDEMVQRFYIGESSDSAEASLATVEDGILKGISSISVPGREVTEDGSRAADIKMIPYYAWNNRGEDSMIIWMPRTRELAADGMMSNLLTETDMGAVLASHTHEDATVATVVDGRLPQSSSDARYPWWTSLPFKNRRRYHYSVTLSSIQENAVDDNVGYVYKK
ncbi:MAG: glycoside hydrolase family 127 protein [Planctomycetota bacterium]|jgi:DUF1680 family protein